MLKKHVKTTLLEGYKSSVKCKTSPVLDEPPEQQYSSSSSSSSRVAVAVAVAVAAAAVSATAYNK